MKRTMTLLMTAGALALLAPSPSSAVTRDIAEVQPAQLTFGQSVINQFSFGAYRDPFDELQNRPYNLLFQNIGRHSNLSPWPGQEGQYTNYLNALIGNNGASNVDNDADTLQGAMIRRETDTIAWGVSAAFITGTDNSDDTAGAVIFDDTDDITGFDLRGAAAWRISDKRVLGGGFHISSATSEVTNGSFETGVGGFFGADEFEQTIIRGDFGMRTFIHPAASWEAQIMIGVGSSDQMLFNDAIDDLGVVTARTVIENFDISDMTLAAYAGYNRLRAGELGESEYRLGIERETRELDNTDLAYTSTLGVVTPDTTLLGQDSLTSTNIYASAKTIFRAGETELFAVGRLGYGMVDGSTSIDASGIIVNEAIDDSHMQLAGTLGVRQPLFRDKLRIVVAGRADLLNHETSTDFGSASTSDDVSQTTSQYSVGLEGVLSNVVFDVAWLVNEEVPVVPVDLGIPSGSRTALVFDRLVFSAGLAW